MRREMSARAPTHTTHFTKSVVRLYSHRTTDPITKRDNENADNENWIIPNI